MPAQHTINSNRLQHRIQTLADIGRKGDGGVYRMALSPADLEARAWLGNEITTAGLELRTDPAANISACWKPELPTRVLSGSHLDSVPGAGHLDGALGVLAALECVERIKELDIPLKHGLEAIAFTDEEGRFGGMLGSQALAGQLSPGVILAARDLNGVTLTDAMAAAGFDAQQMPLAERDRKTLHAFVELHIEQGPVLDSMNCPIGLVQAITGLFKWEITLEGESNHAGTTPMNMRRDALQGVVDFASQLQRVLDEYGTCHSRATIGKLQVFPGAANVVPGKAVFTLEVRDTDAEVMKQLGDAFQRTLFAVARKHDLVKNFVILSELPPAPCSEWVVETVRQQVEALGLAYHAMPSGAAHDCQTISSVTHAGMIFVPSKGGKSHSPHEWTAFKDIEAGTNLLLNTLIKLAS